MVKLPKGWEVKKVIDVTSYVNRGISPKYTEYDGFVVINQRCIRGNKILLENSRLTDPEKKKISDEKYIQKYDVLVNSTGVGTLGRVAQVKKIYGKMTVDSPVTIVRPNDSIHPSYFGYTMVFNQPLIEKMGEGATGQTELSRDRVKNDIEIFIAPHNDQPKIALILSNYDDLIENNIKRVQLLEKIAKMIYEEWFVRFKFPGHEKVKMVNSELGKIPEGWEVMKLQDGIELAYGKALKQSDREEGDFLVYGSSGVVGKHNEFLVEGPGIIVGRKGNVGSVFWTSHDFYPIDTVYYVKSEISLYYVYYNFLNQHFLNNDAAVPGLSRKQAYLLPFLKPDDITLALFEKQIEPIFKGIERLKGKNFILAKTRDLLIPKLISGQVDVSGLDIKVQEVVV